MPRGPAWLSIDHADQLSDETMRLMREKQIFAVPTFTIFEYFADHAASPEQAAREHQMLDLHAQEFRKQLAAGVPMAVGSDVGPFPHGTQAREFVLMVKYGMTPLAALQAGTAQRRKAARLAGTDRRPQARLFRRHHRRPRRSVRGHQRLQKVSFVMKGGVVYRK